MNSIYNQMLSKYDLSTATLKRNAEFEASQQIALLGLANGGFFDKAAFYGGTCLRIFHKLNRFSEDMDFSLLKQDEHFNFENYFQAIIDAFTTVGREHVQITKKNKHSFGRIESAFLKDNTDVYNVSFQTEKSIKIKIEVDTCPPLGFETENKLLLLPKSTMINCYTLADLFAGKMHALVFRDWKHRVKGRDWYDFEWYVRNGVKLNYKHLHQRILQFNEEDMPQEAFMLKLKDKLASVNINQVKEDVQPFIKDQDELAIWSNDYFLQLAQMIEFEQ